MHKIESILIMGVGLYLVIIANSKIMSYALLIPTRS